MFFGAINVLLGQKITIISQLGFGFVLKWEVGWFINIETVRIWYSKSKVILKQLEKANCSHFFWYFQNFQSLFEVILNQK